MNRLYAENTADRLFSDPYGSARKNTGVDSSDLFKTEKTEIFKQYSEENNIDVWFVIGVGGEPNAPEEQYLLPLSKASSNSLTMKELSNYQFTGQLTMESFEKEEIGGKKRKKEG